MNPVDTPVEYKVVEGRIQDPGRFEGEARYVPYFWDAYLNGLADRDDGTVLGFNIDDKDREKFPELKGRRTVRLVQDAQGFVKEV